jgi:hypothetical protein
MAYHDFGVSTTISQFPWFFLEQFTMRSQNHLFLTTQRRRSTAFFLVAAWWFGGCGGDQPPAAPSATSTATAPAVAPDADDVLITEADVSRPKDYADAVARLGGYRDTIRDEIAAGRPTKAHRALDELEIVLNWLPGIARDSDVPKEQWEALNTTAQKIRGLFNQVHSRIDEKQEPDYGSVAKDIDDALSALQAIQATPTDAEEKGQP